jgi:hypothetical protein
LTDRLSDGLKGKDNLEAQGLYVCVAVCGPKCPGVWTFYGGARKRRQDDLRYRSTRWGAM